MTTVRSLQLGFALEAPTWARTAELVSPHRFKQINVSHRRQTDWSFDMKKLFRLVSAIDEFAGPGRSSLTLPDIAAVQRIVQDQVPPNLEQVATKSCLPVAPLSNTGIKAD